MKQPVVVEVEGTLINQSLRAKSSEFSSMPIGSSGSKKGAKFHIQKPKIDFHKLDLPMISAPSSILKLLLFPVKAFN